MEGTTSSQSPSQQSQQSRLGWFADKLLKPLAAPTADELAADQAALTQRLTGRAHKAEKKAQKYRRELVELHQAVEDLLDSLSDDHDIHVAPRTLPSAVEGVEYKLDGLESVINGAAEQEQQTLKALRDAVEKMGIEVVERRELDLTRPRFDDGDDDDDDDESELGEGSDDGECECSGEGEDETALYESNTVFELRNARLEQQELENTAQAHEIEEWQKLHAQLSNDNRQLHDDYWELRDEQFNLQEELHSFREVNEKLAEAANQHDKQREQAQQTIEDLRARLDAAQAERARNVECYKRIRAEYDTYGATMKDQVATLRTALAAGHRREDLAEQAKLDAEGRAGIVMTQLGELQQQMVVAGYELQEHRDFKRFAGDCETRLRQQTSALQEQVGARTDQLAEARRELSQLKQKTTELENQAERDRQHHIVCEQEVASIVQQLRNKDARLKACRELAAELRQEKLAAVDQLAEQTRGHERALAALRQELADERAAREALESERARHHAVVRRMLQYLGGRLVKADQSVALLSWAVEELRDGNEARVRTLEGQIDYLRWRQTGTYAERAQQQQQQGEGDQEEEEDDEELAAASLLVGRGDDEEEERAACPPLTLSPGLAGSHKGLLSRPALGLRPT
ncbi:hypothetical protein PG991_014415 [Apiospora marii]|uniref:Uncharacterized protein n=1 Tax=Apiospora marii TaxID=335849 RepID=A0ABR1R967_9PEZI